MFESLGADLRFASRTLRKSPLFTIVAVVCISLGSGAVTTVFSAMNAMVLRPLPGVTDADRLVRIERKRLGSDDGISASYPYYGYLRARSRTLEGMVAWGKVSLTIGRSGEMGTGIYGNFVSGNLFPLFGVRPELGRFFAPDEDGMELTDPVIVVSDGFWRSKLGADSGAVGHAIIVNGQRFTLIGVAPREFRGLDAPIKTDAWVPLHTRRQLRPSVGSLENSSAIWMRLAGRLKDGMSSDAAHRELSALTAQLGDDAIEPTWFRKYDDLRVSRLTSLPPDASGPLLGFLGLLLGAATLVLLIAGVNVAAMLSVRAISRRREMAVRAALGAARARLAMQLLTEILVLFVLGSLGGMLIALLATRALERLPIPAEIPIALQLSPDLRVFLFAVLVSLLTGVMVGLAPARRAASTAIATRLRDGSAASGTRRTFLNNSLVVAQLALSLLLMVGAGLFMRALQHGYSADPGFDAADVTTVPLDADAWGYSESRGRDLFGALRERIAALPGVTDVSYTSILPLGMHSHVDDIQIDGAAAATSDGRASINMLEVDPGYFSVLRIPLLAGRTIGEVDDERAPRVAVVNQTFAEKFWPDGTALGRTFSLRDERVTIVGIARDAKYASLTESTPALAYFPLAQYWQARRTLMVRSASDPAALVPAIQDALHSIDPELPRAAATSLEDAMGIGLLPQRVAALVTGVLGAAGLLLATVGLYGIIAYSASRRAREIGIRLALGARREDVLNMIVREGMLLTAVGVAIGLALAVAATRLLAGLLVGVSPLDRVTYIAMSAIFVAVTLVASWLPARRAAAADPMAVLREE